MENSIRPGFPTMQHQALAHTFNNQIFHLWNWSIQTRMELRDSDPTMMFDGTSNKPGNEL
jgi:hypothetical protein